MTGVGLVTPLSALGARETWEALLACRTGVRSLTEDDMPPVRILSSTPLIENELFLLSHPLLTM